MLLVKSPAAAENYILNGDQLSQINFQILQKIDPMPDAQAGRLNPLDK